MNDAVHPNIKTLIERMESALQREDFSEVLHASASIFETLAKDIVNIPTIQNQTLKSFFDRFRQDSTLPKEILNYILDVYEMRNKTPLAGHGSTQASNLSRESAIVLCELTKAFVNIEYRTRSSSEVMLLAQSENNNAIILNISLSDSGFEKEPSDNMKGDFVEAIYAAQTGIPIRFQISYLPLQLLEEIVNSERFQDSSLNIRTAKVEIKKLIDHSRYLREIMEDALNLISMKSIINQIEDVSDLISIINGTPSALMKGHIDTKRNLWIETIYDAPGELPTKQNREKGDWIDVFHKNLKLASRFFLGKEQTQTLLDHMGLQSTAGLIGGGWDYYDLTMDIRFQKAIPAILIEVVTNEVAKNPELDINEVLHPSYWRIGLS
ncbi:MAG: hypothetical protein AB1554_11885 [Chloroflexota bacterium]